VRFLLHLTKDTKLFFHLATARSILCIGAHPDDIEIGCGGALLSLLANNPGLRVDWVVMGCTPQRQAEARDAFNAWCNGNTNCTFHSFDFEDTLFPSQIVAIKKAMHGLAQTIQPDIVFTHRREDLHQDHRTLAEVTWNTFRGNLIFEYEIAKYEGDLGNPNVFFPLTTEQASTKVRLLMTHFPSQRTKPWFRSETFDALMRVRGIESKSESGFAEAFHARKIWLAS
jgi:LmbE family N-acetylglucosaminyl deacetylase